MRAEAASQKPISALTVRQAYIADRQRHWGERHRQDHVDAIRLGGECITRGLRKGQAKRKRVGILYDVLSRPLVEVSRPVILNWIQAEISHRAGRARLALSWLRAFIHWAADQPQYQVLMDTTVCNCIARDLPSKKAKHDCLQKEQLATWFGVVRQIANPV